MHKFSKLIMSLLVLLVVNDQAFAEGVPLQTASGETLAAGMGHFSRARALLLTAINEFDEGLKLVNPDALLDAAAFRSNLIDKAKDLERVLDPQPRQSKTGVKYKADSRLLGKGTGKKK